MELAVDRIVVQMPPKEKQALQGKAKRLGINLSELMRRGAANYSDEMTDSDLEMLLLKVQESTAQAEYALEDVLEYVRASNARMQAVIA